MVKPTRKSKGIQDYAEDRRRQLERAGNRLNPKPQAPRQRASVKKKTSMSPAGKRRAGSVGRSSTSRHRSRVSQRSRTKKR